MNIILNGENSQTDAKTLLALLESHSISLEKVACEIDGAVVPKSLYGEKQILDGMKIEIINFVGGG